MWIKCSSLLPKEGTLIMTREPYGDQFDYHGGFVMKSDDNRVYIMVGEDECYLTLSSLSSPFRDLEWKEIEKD